MSKHRQFTDCTYDDIGRIYNFVDASYYSVTTALGATADKEFLVEWRNRIGDEEADRQVAKAQDYGEAFHYCGEMFLKGEDREKQHPFVEMIWKKMIPKLRPITDVLGVEDVLYSDLIKLAGRGDAVVRWNGKLAILDFKLINYWFKEFIHDYWLQCTIYAHMWEFLYGERPELIILAMGNKKVMDTKVLIEKPGPFAKETIARIGSFHAKMAA